MALHVLGRFSATELYSQPLLNVSDRVLPSCPGNLRSSWCPRCVPARSASSSPLNSRAWGCQAALTHLACESFCSIPRFTERLGRDVSFFPWDSPAFWATVSRVAICAPRLRVALQVSIVLASRYDKSGNRGSVTGSIWSQPARFKVEVRDTVLMESCYLGW